MAMEMFMGSIASCSLNDDAVIDAVAASANANVGSKFICKFILQNAPVEGEWNAMQQEKYLLKF